MKRVYVLVAFLVMATMLVPACTSIAPDCTKPEVLCVGLVTKVGKVDDKSFNQAAWEGIQQAKQEGLIQWVQYITTVDARDYEENISTFAGAGYDVIVTGGSALGEATNSAAGRYPDVYFIGVDQFQAPDTEKPNLAGIVFPEDQAGFLAGALAAQMTVTGKVGAVLGSDAYPPAWRYGEGYRAGAKYIDPLVKVDVAYHNDADFAKSSFDPEWGAAAANSMIDEGVDVVFGGSGTTGDNAIVAAAQRGIYIIGVEMDQYYLLPGAAPLLLSSVVKLVNPGTYELLKLARDAQTGTVAFPGGNYSGQCGYVSFHDLDLKVPAQVRARMNDVNQGLLDGTIQTGVPSIKP